MFYVCFQLMFSIRFNVTKILTFNTYLLYRPDKFKRESPDVGTPGMGGDKYFVDVFFTSGYKGIVGIFDSRYILTTSLEN